MIPKFTTSHLQKNIGKQQGDFVTAKIADINRLIQYINEIEYLPNFTYTSSGHVELMQVPYTIRNIVGPSEAGVHNTQSIGFFSIGYFNANVYNPVTDTLTNMNGTLDLSFPLTISGGLRFTNNILQHLSFPNLEYMYNPIHDFGNNMITINCPDLITLDFPKLIKADNFIQITCPSLVDLSLPNLEYANSLSLDLMYNLTNLYLPKYNFSFSINTASILTSITLPSFTVVNDTNVDGDQLNITNCPLLTSISLPVLEQIRGIYIVNCNSLTSFILPSTFRGDSSEIYITNNTALTTVSFGNIGTVKYMQYINLSGNALNSASITNLLDLLLSLDGTNNTVLWTGYTLDLTGGETVPPDAGQLVKIATLIGRGNTISHN
jgi:hypothetical protein